MERFPASDIVSIYSDSLGVDVANAFNNIRQVRFCRCQNCDLYFFDPLVAGTEDFYTSLQNFDWYYPKDKNEFGYAASLISATDSVLEIGCGMGAFAGKISTASYVGLEFSQTAKQMAAKNGVEVRNQSIEDHAVDCPKKYDVVCSFQVLEHVPNLRRFLNAAAHCVRPGGRLILSVPSFDSFARYVTNHVLDLPPHHVTRWTDLALANIARELNLEVEDIWHEPLQEVHKPMYASTIANRAANFLAGRAQRVVDRTLFGKLTNKASGFIGRKCVDVLADDLLSPRGISVTAVYRTP